MIFKRNVALNGAETIQGPGHCVHSQKPLLYTISTVLPYQTGPLLWTSVLHGLGADLTPLSCSDENPFTSDPLFLPPSALSPRSRPVSVMNQNSPH